MDFLIELFTSPNCPNCPAAKRIAENVVKQMDGALLIERDVSLPECAEMAAKYGIIGVPAIVVNGKFKMVGVPTSEDELYTHIKAVK